ncbi:MAG: Crp/Fnr family transcriptional regulator [Thermonemataceae bacterium]
MNKISQLLIEYLRVSSISFELDEHFLRELSKITTFKKYPKNTVLVQEGEYCQSLFIIKKGLLRRYTLHEGKDITLEFALEDDFIASIYSIITGRKTVDFIQTLEDSEVLIIQVEDMKKLNIDSQKSLLIGQELRNNYFLKLENRILSLQNDSAKKRYADLVANQPTIIQRASLGQIASYLGMTQENLSRIRRMVKD